MQRNVRAKSEDFRLQIHVVIEINIHSPTCDPFQDNDKKSVLQIIYFSPKQNYANKTLTLGILSSFSGDISIFCRKKQIIKDSSLNTKQTEDSCRTTTKNHRAVPTIANFFFRYRKKVLFPFILFFHDLVKEIGPQNMPTEEMA